MTDSLPAIRLLPVGPEEKRWRDLDPEWVPFETKLRIGFAVLGVIALAGMALGIYFSITGPLEISFTAIQVSIGGGLALVVPLFTGAIFFNMEKYQNSYLCELNFVKNLEKRERHYYRLTQSDIISIYDAYYRNGCGLGPLVRGGLLTIEEGERLRAIFKDITTYLVATGPGQYPKVKKEGLSVESLERSWDYMKNRLEIKKYQTVKQSLFNGCYGTFQRGK